MSGGVVVDQRWADAAATRRRDVLGIRRFATEVLGRLPGVEPVGSRLPILHPLEPLWLSAVLTRRRPDVYFSPGFNPPARSPVPFLFTIQDLIHVHFDAESGARQRLYYRLIVRPAARRAATVCTASEFAREEVVGWAGVPEDRVVAVGAGVGPAFTPDGDVASLGAPYLLHIGNRKPHKNVPRLLDAFARSGLARELRLAMTGEADAQTVETARSLGIGEAVVFTGRVDDLGLAALYRGATAVVVPSLYEGFGLPVVEAMACGTPVAAAAVASIPEVAGSAAILFDPYDVDDIVGSLRLVVDDDGVRSASRSRGLERAGHYAWGPVAERVARLLDAARS